MDKYKFTKGKWEVVSDSDFIQSSDEIDKTIVCQFFNKYEDYFDNKEYNAQLISKAPEMLEMLLVCLKDYKNIIPQSPARDSRMDEIEQLIKQATYI